VKAALDEYQHAGYQLGITAQFVLLCPALLLRNEAKAALELIDHGLSIVSHNSERCFEAELYRLKARVPLVRGAPDAEAESLLDQALQTARSQQARSLELRAATVPALSKTRCPIGIRHVAGDGNRIQLSDLSQIGAFVARRSVASSARTSHVGRRSSSLDQVNLLPESANRMFAFQCSLSLGHRA
jgi:hypothetical protein